MAEPASASLSLATASSIAGIRVSELAPGYPLLHLQHGEMQATLSLYGGQLLDCHQHGRSLLWRNPSLHVVPGKALRAGVPICWPWFGTLDSALPAHGFVRTRHWQLQSAQHHDDALTVTLAVQDDESSRKLWPHRFALQLQIRLSDVLSVQLLMHNTDDHAWPAAGALHSYFAVSDIGTTQISDLDGVGYVNQLTGEQPLQHGALTFDRETDRIYRRGHGTVRIHDDSHCLQLQQHGNTDTVVWTPWVDKAARLGDLRGDDWRQFVCVETAIANDHAVILAPGMQYAIGFTLSARSER